MKFLKEIALILIVLVFHSCNSAKKEAVTQIEKDFLTIKESRLELVKSYEECLTLFSTKSDVSDGYKRIFCKLSSEHSEQLMGLNLIKTKYLIDLGYYISLDAKNYHRVFYEFGTEGYIAGIIRYGLLYSNIVIEKDSIFSLNLGKIDTLKSIDTYNSIIKVNEYAE